MPLNDYLEKHYGSVPQKGRKSKRKAEKDREEAATAYGIRIIDDNEGDDGWGAPASEANSGLGLKEMPAVSKPKSKAREGSQRTEHAARAEAIDEILRRKNPSDNSGAHSSGEEEGPTIADGAELVAEYVLQRQRQEEEARQARRDRRRAKLEAATGIESSKVPREPGGTRSPSPEPMRYGLQTASVIKQDADRAQERYLRKLREADSDVSGRNAETVYRDAKTGKQLDIEQARKDEAANRQDRERNQLLQVEWNKGLVQQRQQLEEHLRLESVRASGGRLDHGRERDGELRAREHWNDPALKFLVNKKASTATYPQYAGYAPPNRFGIRPGYRWDGVDRSNGYEKDFFKKQATTSARKAEEYSHAVADW